MKKGIKSSIFNRRRSRGASSSNPLAGTTQPAASASGAAATTATGRSSQGKRSSATMLADPAQELDTLKADIDDTKKKLINVEKKLEGVEEKLGEVEKDIGKLEKKKKSKSKKLTKDEKEELKQLKKDKESLTTEKVSLNNEKVSLNNRIAAAQNLQAAAASTAVEKGGGWDMIGVTLPPHGDHTKSTKAGTDVTKTVYVPMKVRTLSHEELVALPESVEIINEFNAKQTTKLHHHDYSEEITAQNESGISFYFYLSFGALARHLKKHDILHMSLISGSINTVGDMDFSVGQFPKYAKDGKVASHDLVVAGEMKPPRGCSSDYSLNYCDYGCVECKTSERHKKASLIRQLYNYMVINGAFFGLFSCYKHHAGFIRDCKGNLLITPCLDFDADKPYTVPQFVSLFLALAAKKEIPASLLGKDGVLVSCDDNCTHTNLPKKCFAKGNSSGAPFTSKKSAKGGSSKQDSSAKGNNHSATTPGSNVDSASVVEEPEEISYFEGNSLDAARSVHDLVTEDGKASVIGRFRSGVARRASLSGKDSVVKVADLIKKPDLEQELEHEYAVYNRLSELSGKCVPYVVAHGRLHENMLYGFATSNEGKVPQDQEMSKKFVDAAKEALTQIHDRGVLHGDIRRENVLRRPSDGAPIIIDFGMSKLVEPGTLSREDRERELAELEEALRVDQ